MRKMARLVTVFALLTLVLASASSALVKKAEISDLRNGSTDIVLGRVMSYESAWDGNLIYTYYSVKVLDRVKGTPPEYVTVRIPGGEVGDVVLSVSETPDLAVGEDAFLFLKNSGGFHEVTGWFQGKYRVKDGKVEDTGQTVEQFKADVHKAKPVKPSTGYKLCAYNWKYLGMSGGKYHSEAWEINATNEEGLSSSSVNSAITAGATVWNNAGACYAFGSSSTGSGRTGPTYDEHNVVCFGNTGGAVAATYIWTSKTCRTCIMEIDLVFDQDYWDFGVNVCGSGTKFDLQNVAAHEFGHWLCLADLYNSADINQTMYGYVDFGECYKKDLYTGDIAGIRAIYGACLTLPDSPQPIERMAADTEGMTVSFAVPKTGAATVQVYNVMGQMVSTLADGNLDAGQHSLTWDGRDASGNAAAPGVYFVMVRGADYAASTKITLVR